VVSFASRNISHRHFISFLFQPLASCMHKIRNHISVYEDMYNIKILQLQLIPISLISNAFSSVYMKACLILMFSLKNNAAYSVVTKCQFSGQHLCFICKRFYAQILAQRLATSIVTYHGLRQSLKLDLSGFLPHLLLLITQ